MKNLVRVAVVGDRVRVGSDDRAGANVCDGGGSGEEPAERGFVSAAQCGAQSRDAVRKLRIRIGRVTLIDGVGGERGADVGSVVCLDGEDARGGCEVSGGNPGGADERGRAVVGGDAYIFKHESADEKLVEAAERVEGGRKKGVGSRGRRKRVGRGEGATESGVEVDIGTGDSGGTERRAEEANMLLLVVCDLVEDVLLRGGKNRDLGPAGDRAGASGVGRGQAGTGCCAQIELRFEVLKIESEVEDVCV